ncbi:MAG: hypothetical protein HY814_15150 [Candidatus Riflebacteria bacterium]|nr:hypothetical protein [Candidatus Riflebacteria bacterium]
MSDYQYFEFQTVDKALSEREMRELRQLSRRARITPTRFMNTYDWSDFRGDPVELTAKYFDGFVHIANWGKRQFILRLPRRLVDPEELQKYADGNSFWLQVRKEHVLLGFVWEGTEGGWEGEGEGWLPSLLPLRADLLGGDRRLLYLGWLLGVQAGRFPEAQPEPPAVSGLSKLTAALESFVEFLGLDRELLSAAAALHDENEDLQEGLELFISRLPETRKNALLTRAARGDAPYLQAELIAEFQKAQGTRKQKARRPAAGRTVADLLAAAFELGAEGIRRPGTAAPARRTSPEPEKKQRAAAGRTATGLWKEIERLVETRNTSGYEKAARLLAELRELTESGGRAENFTEKLTRFRCQHGRKTALIRCLDQAGLC